MKLSIPADQAARALLFLNVVVTMAYILWWLDLRHAGNPFLYGLLLIGEIYHVLMALAFWFTVRARVKPHTIIRNTSFTPSVDIFITVAGEPVEVVEETLKGALAQTYPSAQVFILNDGFVAKKENWQEMEELAARYGAGCITRRTPGGAKAGNINHALKKTSGEFVVILDADMVPQPEFLQKIMPAFADPHLAFVQTPQFYSNAPDSMISGSAWEQQALFFGPIMEGKDQSNAAFICGTNVAIRRTALEEVGGMCEDNIAEDFLTSLRIHQKGWKSLYHSEVLCTGLAPCDILSYVKQQLRWARGSLEVLFGSNPVFKPGLKWKQKLEYLSSGLYYLNGLVVAIDIAVPIACLFFGWRPVEASTTNFAALFLPFIFLNLITLSLVTQHTVSFRALAFSQSSWVIQLQALWAVLRRKNIGFVVTPKQAQTGNFLNLAAPHLMYILLGTVALAVGVWREGFSPSVLANGSWVLFNSIMFLPFIYCTLPDAWIKWFTSSSSLEPEAVRNA